MQTLLYLYVGSSLLLALISLPLIAGKIRPNPFYGFRISQTLENPRMWYAVNAYFAKRQLAVALVEFAAAVGLYFWPGISVDAYALSCLGVFVAAFGVAFVQVIAYIKHIK